jgi:hypothetical protein
MIRRRKLLEIAAESPASGARFVGWRAVVQDLLIVKEPARIKFDKVLHELLTFTTDKNHKLPTRKIITQKYQEFPIALAIHLAFFHQSHDAWNFENIIFYPPIWRNPKSGMFVKTA